MDRPSVNQIAPGTHLERSNGKKKKKKCAIVAYPPHSAAGRPIPKKFQQKAHSQKSSGFPFRKKNWPNRYTVAIVYI
jgi:hypothetical protein